MMQHRLSPTPSPIWKRGSPSDRSATLAALGARFAAKLTAAAMLCSLVACGGSSLKHTIDNEALRTLTGEPATKVAEARAMQKKREGVLLQTRQERDGAKKQLQETEARKEQAAQQISAAERGLESAESARDKSVSAADARKAAAVAAAEKAWTGEVDAAKKRYSEAKGRGNSALSTAERAETTETARIAYEEALVEERQALVTLRSAELWLARAKLERVKLEGWLSLNKIDPKEAAEKRAAFDMQSAEREKTTLDARGEHNQKTRATAAAKAQLDRLLNKG